MDTLSQKLIVIVGQTASGKSKLAIELAKHFHGAILSADSRQVYRGMDIGTGKVTTSPQNLADFGNESILVSEGIPHFGIDIADPKDQYTIALYKEYAGISINQIQQAGYTPIICGGTGHWIDACIYNESLPEVGPDTELRQKLNQETTENLFAQLQTLDPHRAKGIDAHNRRRIIRALEINLLSGKPVPEITRTSYYDVLWLGIQLDKEQLQENIKSRLKARLDAGMLDEVSRLHEHGISWQRLEDFGLEYKYCSLVLQGKLSESELFDQLYTAIRQYAKRQMTWFKRNKNIQWINNEEKAKDLVQNFLQK
jgi:tRNA dimethylallyltransferase